MALYLQEAAGGGGSEEANIRPLVENCAHNDDITPLVRLVFEAQSLAESPDTIAADGQRMVAIIGGALRAVAADQGAAVREVCASNAAAIAATVGELEAMAAGVAEVRALLVGGNAAMQAAGGALVATTDGVTKLAEVQRNLAAAAGAVSAAQAVLEQCLAAGQLIDEHQLYAALCLLDKIRRQHLASLLGMLSSKGGAPEPVAAAAAAGGGGGAPRGLAGRDLEHLSTLHAFFSGLVDDLTSAVQRLALQGFNQWLVAMRAAARELGMAAIQAAAVERSLDEDLATERRALLAALAGGAKQGVREIAAEFASAPFRQALLKDAAGHTAATQPVEEEEGPEQRGGSITLSTAAGLRELLGRRPSKKGFPIPTSAAAAAAVAAAEAERAAAEPAELPDLEELFPGEPHRAIRALVQQQKQRSGTGGGAPGGGGAGGASGAGAAPGAAPGGAGGAGGRRTLFSRLRASQDGPPPAAAPPPPPPRAVGSLPELDMSGLFGAVHVARSLGQLDAFRAHYLSQRALQIAADLQPRGNFMETHQAYLAQVTGFFVVESYVQRVSGGLVGAPEGAALWGGALPGLRAALSAALEGLGSAPLLLMVKDFVALAAVALERAGYQVAPVTEVMLAGQARYHQLLAATLQAQLSAVVEADVLAELEITIEAQHAALVAEWGLPAQLEGAAPPRKGAAAPSVNGVPPLPYVAPFTACVPEALRLVRRFVADSVAYLRGLTSPGELLPAVLHQRDRMMAKVLVEVLSSKARSVANAEMLRESMKAAANAWAIGEALDALDDWTIAAARPDAGGAPPGPAASRLSRARNRKAALASGALSGTVQAALRALQDSSERDVLRSLAGRIEQLLEGSRRGDWTPPEPLPMGQSPWVDALLSFLQETFDAGLKLLPRPSMVRLMRRALAATGAAAVRAFGPDGGVRAFNLYAVEKLAANVAHIQRFAGRWGVDALGDELAEPTQLCTLLLSGKLEDFVSPDVRRQRYAALEPGLVASALDRYKETPQQAKRHPQWPSKKAAEAVARHLRAPPPAAGAAAAPRADA
ncbi:SEC15A [Scenedesmus sp. PABB004]|nr:SEC15A [Scenedesmus sp. PABB004]